MQPRAISPTQSGKHEMSVREQSWGLKEYLQNPAAGVVYVQTVITSACRAWQGGVDTDKDLPGCERYNIVQQF